MLVARAPTTTLNPGIDRQVIEEALEDDPEAARAEWLAEFRADIADFISREVVEGLVSPGVHERPRRADRVYAAFCDPAGGSGSDSFTLAIAAKSGECAELVAVRERRPPFSPEAVVRGVRRLGQSYGLFSVQGDAMGASGRARRSASSGSATSRAS